MIFRPISFPLITTRNASNSSKRWINRQLNDKFTKDSKASNYRSRAAFKLIELDKKFKLFNKSSRNIIDLGFAPGAWSQVALEKSKLVGIENPNIIGIDLINCNPPEGVHFVQGDVFNRDTQDIIRNYFAERDGTTVEDTATAHTVVDLVLSDMMTNTSGVNNSDHFGSMDLCMEVLRLAVVLLKPRGNLVTKFYTGKEEHLLKDEMDRIFTKVYRYKPAACRKESKEMYFIGLKRKDTIV